MKLGRLTEISVRDVWAHEQYDFSKWLAKEENMAELSEVLCLSLTDIETEKFVGSYRCDILCKDEFTGKTVLIENQLDSTDHDHLGKIITYASGLDADVIVWIVENAREEHSSAVEWLNKHTDKDVSFFLIEIHAYKIGDSDPAPMFKIIEQPNDFVKTVREMTSDSSLTAAEGKRLEFWEQFNDLLEQRGKPFNKRKASTDNWYSIGIGSSICHIDVNLINSEHRIRVHLRIPDNKDLFERLLEQREAIEASFGKPFEWESPEDKKVSCISTYIIGLDFNNQENYTFLMNEIIGTVIKMREIFVEYI